MEKDYEFLLRVKYKDADLDVEALFSRRIRDGILITAVLIFVLLKFSGKISAFLMLRRKSMQRRNRRRSR